MNERRGSDGPDSSRDHDGPLERKGQPRGGEGPEDTGFLNLEMSKVLLAEAEEIATEAGREIMREVIRERLKERLGDRLRAVALLVADALADDLEANLAIERTIESRKGTRQDLEERVRAALAPTVRPENGVPRAER